MVSPPWWGQCAAAHVQLRTLRTPGAEAGGLQVRLGEPQAPQSMLSTSCEQQVSCQSWPPCYSHAAEATLQSGL